MNKNYILTEKTKELLKDFLKNCQDRKAMVVLNNLPEFKNELLIDLKNLVRNNGRSTMVSVSEINDLIEKYEVGDAKPDEN